MLNQFLAHGTTLEAQGNIEQCRYCGAYAQSPNGTFRLGDAVMAAIRATNVSKQDVETFRDTVEAVKEGRVAANDATIQLESRNSAFAVILAWAARSGITLDILLNILILVVTCYGIWSSDQSSTQARADAQAQLKATQRQTKATESAAKAETNAAEALQKIDAQIERLNELTEGRAPAKAGSQNLPPSRQQRRAAEKPWKNKPRRR